MAKQTRLYWLHALSPVHIGAGRGVGYIDLPIMREKVTNWPVAPGSAIKGIVADYYQATDDNRGKDSELKAAFGTAGDNDSTAGALVFTDARLVCLPVRSFYGTFAWCTSAMALNRLGRDLEAAGHADELSDTSRVPEANVELAAESELTGNEGRVYFEDLDFKAMPSAAADKWAEQLSKWVFPEDEKWQAEFRKRFAILPDEVFDSLTETGTEVAARIRIDDEKKSVAKGALWYEESLPAETIMSGMVWCDRVFEKSVTQEAIWQRICNLNLDLQIGGKASVGKGRVRCTFVNGGNHA